MSNDTVFREKVEEVEIEIIPDKPRETEGLIVTDIENKPEEIKKKNALEDWEIANGKYGLELLGIKEIANEFPLKGYFGILDKYIKEQIGDESTPAKWQSILAELEGEVKTEKLDPYKRLKKLSEYIQVIQKLNKLNELKASFN